MFIILSSLFISFTVTLNSTVVVSPSNISTLIPLVKLSCVNSALLSPPTLMLPGTNVVPVGMLSFTVTVSGAVPLLLSNVIIYVISFPAVTLVPASGSDVLLGITFGLCTSTFTSFVVFSSTTAAFTISDSYCPSVNSSTSTWKLTSASPCFGTFTVIPSSKLLAVFPVSELFTLILPSTKLVPSGMLSLTTTSFPKSPALEIVIVYVIFSPSTTYSKSFSVSCDLLAEIIGSNLLAEIIGSIYVCSTTFVCLSFTVAVFIILFPFSKVSLSTTFTLNSNVFVPNSSTDTSIPFAKFSAVNSTLVSAPILILPFTNSVPAGIVSFTVTVSGAVPSFLKFIVYVISCPFSTVSPLAGDETFSYLIFALFTFISTSFVSFSST